MNETCMDTSCRGPLRAAEKPERAELDVLGQDRLDGVLVAPPVSPVERVGGSGGDPEPHVGLAEDVLEEDLGPTGVPGVGDEEEVVPAARLGEAANALGVGEGRVAL